MSPVLRPHFITSRDYAALVQGGRDAALGDQPRGAAGPGDARASRADAAAAGRADAGGGGSGLFVVQRHRAAGHHDQRRFAALHRAQFGGARGRGVRRRAGGSVLRSAAGQGIPQEIQADEAGRRQAPAAARCSRRTRNSAASRRSRNIAIVEFRPPFQPADIERSRAAGRDSSRAKATPPKSFRRSSSNIATTSCGTAISPSTSCTAASSCRNSWCASISTIRWCAPTKSAPCAW